MRFSLPTRKKPDSKTPARKAIEKQALETLRRVRAKFQEQHGDLMDRICELYEQNEKAAQAAISTPAPKPEPQDIPIDREKNIETVVKFLVQTKSEMIKRAMADQL